MSPNAPDSDAPSTVPRGERPFRLPALLHERQRFDSLLARLSATFIHLPAEAVDGQVEHGLRQLVEFLGIERSTLLQFSEDRTQLVTTHSYAAPGFPPFPPVNLVATLPWYAARARAGELLRFARLPDELPAEAVAEREYCRQSGLRAQLTIPFKVGDVIFGGIGFGSFRRQRDWPDDLVQNLQVVAEVFANALARKRADVALRENEVRLRMLLESTHAVPWVADARSWRFTYVGPQAHRLLGYPTDAWYGDGFWADRIHPDDREQAVAFCLEHSGRDTEYQFEYRMVSADGRAVWVHDIVNVVRENGSPKTLRGFLIDVTARRQAEEDLQGLREHLGRVGRATLMGELAASIAHEVNQPLCAIVANAQAAERLLAGAVPDLAEVGEAVRDISRDGQRAGAVIDRIRGLLRKAPLQQSPVEVNDLLREVAALVRGEMTGRGVSVKLERADQLPMVHGERVQLQQVVLNLLANGADAIDRVPHGVRELGIRSAADGPDAVQVGVSDTGAGLAPADRGRLFAPFYTTKPGGLGLGLAICKSIVEAHGGGIRAGPNAGGGAVFEFTLPGEREGTP